MNNNNQMEDCYEKKNPNLDVFAVGYYLHLL
jgi:hypothetical protein